MMKLEDWNLVQGYFRPVAPEESKPHLAGDVFGHTEFDNGSLIRTSAIASASRDGGKIFVTTVSGSAYELGEVSPLYEALYPNARERLIKTLFG